MQKTFFLEHASQFHFGKHPMYNRGVYIQKRAGFDGVKWALTLEVTQCWCLGKDNEFHYEPIPSERTNEFLNLTRFDTYEEAWEAWESHIKKNKVSALHY